MWHSVPPCGGASAAFMASLKIVVIRDRCAVRPAESFRRGATLPTVTRPDGLQETSPVLGVLVWA